MTRLKQLDRDIALIRAASADIEAQRARSEGATTWAAAMEKNAALWREKAAQATA